MEECSGMIFILESIALAMKIKIDKAIVIKGFQRFSRFQLQNLRIQRPLIS